MRPYSQLLYCMCAILLLAPAAATAQQQPAPAATAYTTFVRGLPVGREDVRVRSDASGLTVTSEGRIGAPTNLIIRRAEFRYGPDGAPQLFELEGTANGGAVRIRTTIAGNTATTESTQNPTVSQPVSPQTLLHANGIVASYVAMARRLGDTAPGSEIRMLVVPQSEIGVRLVNVQNDKMQLGAEFLGARRYDVILLNAGTNIAVTVTTDVNGNLLSVRIP